MQAVEVTAASPYPIVYNICDTDCDNNHGGGSSLSSSSCCGGNRSLASPPQHPYHPQQQQPQQHQHRKRSQSNVEDMTPASPSSSLLQRSPSANSIVSAPQNAYYFNTNNNNNSHSHLTPLLIPNEASIMQGHQRQESNVSSISGSAGSATLLELDGMILTEQPSRFDQSYALVQPIYKCNVSKTYQCVRRSTNTMHCVKIIDHRRFNHPRSDQQAVDQEIRMLKMLRARKIQSNVVELVDVLHDEHHDYIITEFVSGGTLQSIVQSNRGGLPEHRVKRIAHSLIQGLKELHDNNLVHHNICPENILMDDNDQVRLCDFGCSHQEDECSCQYIPHAQYAAPELIMKLRHTKSIDMWSVGVLLYYCLSGNLPFEGNENSRKKICIADYSFYGQEWDHISREAKQLIYNLLNRDADIRFTATDALQHEWFHSLREPKLLSKTEKPKTIVKRVLSKFSSKKKSTENSNNERSRSFGTVSCTSNSTTTSSKSSSRRRRTMSHLMKSS